jgi:hypothetical protein
MFANCNTLRLSYSQLKAPLKIRQNDEKSRDFTQIPSQPANNPAGISAPSHPHASQFAAPRYNPSTFHPMTPAAAVHNSAVGHQAAFAHPTYSTSTTNTPNATIVASTPHAQQSGGFISAGAAQYVYNGTSAPGKLTCTLICFICPAFCCASACFC